MAEQGAAAPESLAGGSYEIIRRRLGEQARALGEAADRLNEARKRSFGGQELSVVGNERIRTENNCSPRDIIDVGGALLFAYNVFLGLKRDKSVADALGLYGFEPKDGGFDLSPLPLEAAGGFLTDPRFTKDFRELHEYHKDARLLEAYEQAGKLLLVFQTTEKLTDVRVLRFGYDSARRLSYIDNRGERDHAYPPSHDFEWTPTSREMHSHGRHPHVNILNEVFVETVGGDLTIKVEDNTEDGLGVYREPVEDRTQALDDAEIAYARLGPLILLRILPFRETTRRYLVFNTRTKGVKRIDAIGRACVQLPENHGIVFPGGYYLQSGDTKIFDGDFSTYEFKRALRSPNGEDVLYAFRDRASGQTQLLPYNLIQKEVQNPIACHGFTVRPDGRLIVFRTTADEATRVHPVQIWQTPFLSDELAAAAPAPAGFLGKIGNAELVRGISDAYGLRRSAESEEPTRELYEDLIAQASRVLDTYFWLGHAEVGLKPLVEELRATAGLIVDEFDKVVAIRRRTHEALELARTEQKKLVRELRPEHWDRVQSFMEGLTQLQSRRGHVIGLRELRYVDLAAVDELEKELVREADRVSRGCVQFLLGDKALEPIRAELVALEKRADEAKTVAEIEPMRAEGEKIAEGLGVISEVVAGLQVDDATARTRILERISEVFAVANRVRAAVAGRKKELLGREGRAEFGAQFKLFGQSVQSALALCDTPERCDEQLSRLMVHLEELESRFSELDEFAGDLASKREEVYDAVSAKKQTLLDERQRRVGNLAQAAERILVGVARRAKGIEKAEELSGFFASDPMILKLRQITEELLSLGASVRADEIGAKLKSAQQEGMRNLRDKTDLFAEGAQTIKLGRHKFNVNTQPFELAIVPRGDGLAFHLTGTDYFDPITDPELETHRALWDRQLASESASVYRAEYLAASVFFAAEEERPGWSMSALFDAALAEPDLLEKVRKFAEDRYDEGYERGIHDVDAAKILGRLLHLHEVGGLLRFSASARALAIGFWAGLAGGEDASRLTQRARSLVRLRELLGAHPGIRRLGEELSGEIARFAAAMGLSPGKVELAMAGEYLVEELGRERVEFVRGAEAERIKTAFLDFVNLEGARTAFEEDLRRLEAHPRERLELARSWVDRFLASGRRGEVQGLDDARLEAAMALVTEGLPRRETAAAASGVVEGLLGQHPRVVEKKLTLRLDEFLLRLGEFRANEVPAYARYRQLRHELLERERRRLRLDEFSPRVLSSFVRNRLINEVYLPLIGDNLAKQLGAAGAAKRTDLMGMLLLVSPPGYGKTTLMEYVASRLGMIFMKVNGPALGHEVVSLDPAEAPNATARQEVEKVNLALEMGNNVMLYLDDIQHTSSEFLQKFISLCDGQRRIEGVHKGRTRTYDLRGKKFCIGMAGNPYTESGAKFQIPDMLANRADTYNLGDILNGREEVFALSYLENSLTSNSTLAPLASRAPEDVFRFVRLAEGREVPRSEFAHDYSAGESEEIVKVLRHLMKCRDTLLLVNAEYIRSAAMEDAFRTEPPFKLQGSYRNMNKLAEKVVPAMNDRELEAVITDHYAGESQTLTSAAEQNLLKLGELRGTLDEAGRARFDQIKSEFRRLRLQGGGDQDPVARVTGTLSGLGRELEGIEKALRGAVEESRRDADRSRAGMAVIAPQLAKLERALGEVARPVVEVKLDGGETAQLAELIERQKVELEEALLPLVRASTKNLESAQALRQPLIELIELLKLSALGGARLGSGAVLPVRGE